MPVSRSSDLDQSGGFAGADDVAMEWQPIASVLADVELELGIYDKGEYHALAFPCRREGSGWRDVRANRSMWFEPTHWRLWDCGRA
jgi:hypothetical protein